MPTRLFVEAIQAARPWVTLHSLELTRHPEHARQYQAMAAQLGQEAASVPALLFCGEMHVGWDKAEASGVEMLRRLDACHTRQLAGATAPGPTAERLMLPVLGEVDPQHFSLPLLTLAIAALDAFNPCAFFVLLIAPARLNNLAVAFALLGIAVAITWGAARLTRPKNKSWERADPRRFKFRCVCVVCLG